MTARSIAYAATLVNSHLSHLSLTLTLLAQLVLNLTDTSQWVEVYNSFNFEAFYNFIVDYFEYTPDQASRARADNLLKWWTG